MTRFRKLSVEIDAVQYRGLRDAGRGTVAALFAEPEPDWLREAMRQRANTVGAVFPSGRELHIATLEGTLTVAPGDWIIRGITGELYPCKPHIFAQTYAPVTDADPPLCGV